MENTNRNEEKKKKGGKINAGTAVLAVAVVVLIGVIAYLLLRGEGDEKRNIVVTPENVDEVFDQLEEQSTEPGYYTVTMNNIWHFATGEAVSSDAHVENSTLNTQDVYFDVFLAEDEENAVYKSPVIPVGSSLEQIALDTPLDAGTYDCVAVYHLLDGDQNTLSTLRVSVTIIVEG